MAHTCLCPPAVVITGASTGIGAACALELDRRGFRVFAGVRSQPAAEALRAKTSSGLTPVLIDVTEIASIIAAVRTVGEALGEAGLAGLVNNAGIAVPGPLEALPIDSFRRQLEVNVVGQVAVTQAFLPLLRRARGRVVNMGSVNGTLAPPYLGAYAASKFAMEAVTDALRVELRTWGIGVSIVEPGAIDTPIWEKSFAAADRLANDIAPELLSLYEADLAAVRRASAQWARGAESVECVVRAVLHALSARRPKTRYAIGWGAWLPLKSMKLLPDRLRDWIVRKSIGLP
jgi:NAD(P)-dependent dehydrogenase (short-subunit alcohol dehydrogenase family)